MMLAQLTAFELAEMIAFERIERVPKGPQEIAAEKRARFKAMFDSKRWAVTEGKK